MLFFNAFVCQNNISPVLILLSVTTKVSDKISL